MYLKIIIIVLIFLQLNVTIYCGIAGFFLAQNGHLGGVYARQ